MQQWIFVMRREELAVLITLLVLRHITGERHERVLLHSLWLYDKLKQFLCYTTLLQLKFLILESVHQGLHVVSDRNFLSACGIFDWNFKDRTLRCEEGSEPRCAGQSVTELGVCSVTRGSSEMELKEGSLWHVVDSSVNTVNPCDGWALLNFYLFLIHIYMFLIDEMFYYFHKKNLNVLCW